MKQPLLHLMRKIYVIILLISTSKGVTKPTLTKLNCEIVETSLELKRDLIIGGNINNGGGTCLSGQVLIDLAGSDETINFNTNKTVYIICNTGVPATATLQLPEADNLSDGQTYKISANDANLTTLITAGTGTILSSSMLTNPSNIGIEIMYCQADTTWYRIS